MFHYLHGKGKVLIGAIIYSILSNMLSFWFEGNNQIEQIISLPITIGYGVLTLFWCKMDADERNENVSARFRFLVVIFGVFALVYYLFKSRGLKKGFISFGYALLFFVVLVLVSGNYCD
jgi:hypothetical protein